jgi:hypothetical protein
VPAFLHVGYAAGGGVVSTLHDGFKPAEPPAAATQPRQPEATGDSQSL